MGIFDIIESDSTRKIQRDVRGMEIVDYGYITEAYDDSHVMVHMATEPIEIPCVLMRFSIKGLSVDVKPSEGDKVAVIFPRRFSNDMFDSDGEVVGTAGYDIFSGMAIPISTFKSDSKSILHMEQDGSASLELDSNASLEAKIGGAALKLTDKTLNYANGSGTIEMDASGKTTINGHLEILP